MLLAVMPTCPPASRPAIRSGPGPAAEAPPRDARPRRLLSVQDFRHRVELEHRVSSQSLQLPFSASSAFRLRARIMGMRDDRMRLRAGNARRCRCRSSPPICMSAPRHCQIFALCSLPARRCERICVRRLQGCHGSSDYGRRGRARNEPRMEAISTSCARLMRALSAR
jgi:hypothetical protein